MIKLDFETLKARRLAQDLTQKELAADTGVSLATIKQIETGTVWKREVPIKWQCLVCGYVYEGLEPPKVCPACDHPYQHFIALDMDEL